MIESVWANDNSLPSFPALNQDINTEILIVGGGLAGILCAWQMQQRGIPYVLIEADRICGGITRNTTAKITAQHGLIYKKLLSNFGEEKAKAYWQVNQNAVEEFGTLAQAVPCDFEYRSSYLYAMKSRGALEGEMEAMERLGIPFSFRKTVQLPFPVAGSICLENQAQFHPLKLAAGLVPGMHIYEHTKAKEFVGNTVRTERGTIHASKIVICTHFPILNKHGGYFLKMYQQRSYVLALENAQQIDGMYRDADEKGLSFRSYGNLLLLGGGGHRTGKKGGGWEQLRTAASLHYPQARVVTQWAAQDCMTLDGVPYIGHYGKGTSETYVATGFNKWGMTTSMAAASVLADLVQGKKTVYTELFSPQRSSMHPKLFTNAVEATVNLLTPTAPRCPHLGCALKWNPQEHSWDCPCHGSRFDSDGKLLDGPATGNLPDRKRE